MVHSWPLIYKLYAYCIISYSFSGDRLTDERVQGAQQAMSNAGSAKERLEEFISKTEDFHRLMNFLEVQFLPWLKAIFFKFEEIIVYDY